MPTVHSLKLALARVREHNKDPMTIGKQTGAVVLTSGLMGYVNGRYGDSTGTFKLFQKVPVDLLAGIGLHLAAMAPGVGRHAAIMHDAGDGALAAFGYRTGQSFGVKARTGAPASAQGTLSGYTPYQMGPAQAGLNAFASQWATAHG